MTHSLHWKKGGSFLFIAISPGHPKTHKTQLAIKQLYGNTRGFLRIGFLPRKQKNQQTIRTNDEESPSLEAAAEVVSSRPCLAQRRSQLNKQVTASRALCLHDTVHMHVACRMEGRGGGGISRVDRLRWEAAPAVYQAAGRRMVGDYRLASGRKCQCLSAFRTRMMLI